MRNETNGRRRCSLALTMASLGATVWGCTTSDSLGLLYPDNEDGGGGAAEADAAAPADEPVVPAPALPGGGTPAAYTAIVDGVCTAPVTDSQYPYAWGYTPDPSVLQTVQTLMSQMSHLDKAAQMRGTPFGSAGGPQLTDIQRSLDRPPIRGFRYRDGSRGMNLAEDMDGVKPNAATVNGSQVGYSTAFPVSVARGASFDLDLEFAIGEAIGDEMLAAKQTVLLAPSMNLMRHPLWGRAQESYGEDPFQLGRMASAMTWGVQRHVAACAKDYMAYSFEQARAYSNSLLDEQTLRETYGRHFRMVVRDGGVAAVMASYNSINGVKAVANPHVLTDVLRTDFGFRGFVLSQWWAMDPGFTIADSTLLKSSAIASVRAGLDVELPWSLNYGTLESIINSQGGLTLQDVDTSVARILEQKVRFNAHNLIGSVGLGQAQTSYAAGRISNDAAHLALAERAALESMVLLKNANSTLPIAPTVKKIAVLGATVPAQTISESRRTTYAINFATDVVTGDEGTSRVIHDPSKGVGPLAGIQAAAPAGVTVVTGSTASAAADADFVVVVAGLTPEDEGEEFTTLTGDRTSLALDAKQTELRYFGIQNGLIESVALLGKPMVVVLQGGSVIDMPWLAQVPAVVMAWYPGMVGGRALGRLLFGQASFSGKLPITWGTQLGDYAPFSGADGNTSFDYWVGYRHFDHANVTPLFPFGHGLSYTSFAYRRLDLPCTAVNRGAAFPVTVTVANTGTMDADEVVMVFVSFPNTQARRPAKELKGFARVSLKAGEERPVTILVRTTDLDYWDMPSSQWVIEPGTVTIMAGPNAATLPLVGSVTIQ